jgi:transglutaminase-like putative cysteine protease
MWVKASCSLDFRILEPSPFIFMLRPRSGWQQWVGSEEYVLEPSIPVVEFTDPFGNLCQRMVAMPGEFSVRTSVKVECAEASDSDPCAPYIEVQKLPDETLPFLLPSRYCESDRFNQMATSIVGDRIPGYDQCSAIVDYIRRTTRYTPGSGSDIVSAGEVNQRSDAVCRDLAHLGIACCRALSIPARMVVGYLECLEPMDLHAWFEAYLGGRWYTFDPTQDSLQGGRIAIAYGRDAADVAVYTQFGNSAELLSMQVTAERIQALS